METEKEDEEVLLQVAVDALSVGSVYALISMGYNLVYGILGQLNFAHGDVYTVGCFITFTLFVSGVNPILAIIIGVCAGAVVNLIVERFAYRPLRKRGSNRIAPTISAVGIAYIMRNIVQLIWGPQTYAFDLQIIPSKTIQVGNAYVGTLQIWILLIAVLIMVLMTMALKKTKWGQAIVSISQDITTSSLMGIKTDRIIAIIYGLGAALGVIGGILFCSYYGFIYMGIGFAYGTMKAWMATIWGGIGSLKGAIVGALCLGIIETFVGAYVSTTYKDVIVWLVFIIFIMVRPHGLFPQEVAEKV
ncbi:branched-chain amino acid ABC transporter permease [Lachnoclostridium sp. An138]|uniref:branched-chain amino acid ABC transporter permease n=1 Tax=Lachnoclostridium sp. An138 TaxID=1965560 RepID=UPI000B38B79D|nr:branched-chain amino acid ABC transporter permease [Lachnoclostridium sp. An138]OUQ18919.1 hypothetical protein B5E82_07510 [Lachnoclostridium sp. An138]